MGSDYGTFKTQVVEVAAIDPKLLTAIDAVVAMQLAVNAICQ